MLVASFMPFKYSITQDMRYTLLIELKYFNILLLRIHKSTHQTSCITKTLKDKPCFLKLALQLRENLNRSLLFVTRKWLQRAVVVVQVILVPLTFWDHPLMQGAVLCMASLTAPMLLQDNQNHPRQCQMFSRDNIMSGFRNELVKMATKGLGFIQLCSCGCEPGREFHPPVSVSPT